MVDSHDEVIPGSMWRAAILISLSSLLFGYALASLNSCLVVGDGNSEIACFNGDDDASPNCPPGSIYDDMKLTTLETQIATSLTIVGAWIGCLWGSGPSEAFGRRTTLLGNNVFFIAGGLLAASGIPWLLFAGRLVTGLGVGVTSVVAPVLLSEVASPATRGFVTTLHQGMLTFGILLAGVLSYGFVVNVNHGWQYVQAFPALVSAVMLVFSHWVPESPKWLVGQGRRDEALQVLVIHRPKDMNCDAELVVMERECSTTSKETATWREVFEWKDAVIVGCSLMLIQGMTGINSVIFYSTTIFGFAGFHDSILATSSVGVVNALTCLLAVYLVDRVGRKTLLMGGTSVMLLALVTLSVVLLQGGSLGESTQGIIAVVAVLVFVFGFSIGLGATCWVVMSELMPTRLRSKAFSLFVSLNWFANLIIGLLTLTSIDALGGVKGSMNDDQQEDAEKNGVAYLYLIFAVVTAVSLFFIFFEVPETKGSTPEQLRGIAEPKGSTGVYADDSDSVLSPLVHRVKV